MELKFFKENLPWIVPSVAVVFAASGYFDRGFRTEVAPTTGTEQFQSNSDQAAASSLVVATSAVQTTTWTNDASQDQLVSRTDAGIGSNLASEFATQNQPSFTDKQPDTGAGMVAQPLQASTKVA
jgi:hypothetical protein